QEQGHREHWPLESSVFKNWLKMKDYRETGEIVTSAVIDDAQKVLCAEAKQGGCRREVYHRVGAYDGNIYLDLGDKDWRAVEIGPHGWRVMQLPPVCFRRTSGMQPLPEPVRGGDIYELGDILNVGDERNLKIVIAWLLRALQPKSPYPLLLLHGEQGTAK